MSDGEKTDIERRRATGLPVVGALTQTARRVGQTARNVAEVVRFGGLETDDSHSPYEVAAEQPIYRLRHYFADTAPTNRAPILLIPPLMMTTEVWDVSPDTSAVAALHAEGVDPWVIDFGRPDHEPGGLERTLTDHVLAVSDAVDRVAEATGRKVVLAGYSQGGMFAYQAAAYRRGKDLDSIVAFGSPVDTTAPLPLPLAPEVVNRLANEIVASGLLKTVAIPEWLVRLGFKSLSPAKSIQGRIQFLMQLHDRDALVPRERQRQFLDRQGWTAYSGPAVAELLEQFVVHNRMLEGGFVIDDELVTLADIDVPVLTVVGTQDTFGHPDSARAIRRAAPRAEIYEITLNAGHFGLVVGSNATSITWPAVGAWLSWRDGLSDLPPDIVPAESVDPGRTLKPSTAATALAHATEFGIGVGRVVVTNALRASRVVRSVARDAPAQLPKLARLQQIDPSTRISLALLLDEQAARNPNEIAFLFGDRAHRQWDVKQRVDNVVKGLVSIGVRQGERVGVLMGTRPSAFVLVAALSRLGATGVLLRPDADVAREVALGAPTWVISDPEHASLRQKVEGVQWAVLGGGPRDGSDDAFPGAVDMERIDPDEVELPGWYDPDPHRAHDIGFVLFSGEGEGTRTLELTNGRWALSALGTASAAALRRGDTIYSTTPLYHSSALLMSIGGAVAGGARFAMSSADDVTTFWQEVRRYGATHVAYTWSSLRDVVDGPPDPAERHHPVRMFMGSGMPRNLWRRTLDRFPTATVLEFYASAGGDVILANVTGRSPGAMGRSLPGTSEVRVAACDLTTGRLRLDDRGLARECAVDEVGLLLARVEPGDSATTTPMRGVFEVGDAWRSTGDLFLRDEHGLLWLAGPVAEVVRSADGPVIPSGARFALGSLPSVDLVVAYGVTDGDADVLVAAATLRGTAFTAADLDRVMGKLPALQRPVYVMVVDDIPLTTWHRPQWRDLQAEGVPAPGEGRRVWRLGPDRAHYRELS
ncbi:AMP-binding protein [Jatrophihabitans fulvus]